MSFERKCEGKTEGKNKDNLECVSGPIIAHFVCLNEILKHLNQKLSLCPEKIKMK